METGFYSNQVRGIVDAAQADRITYAKFMNDLEHAMGLSRNDLADMFSHGITLYVGGLCRVESTGASIVVHCQDPIAVNFGTAQNPIWRYMPDRVSRDLILARARADMRNTT